uniref:target of rapamycin complex 2 subunit MAPKAP1-like n=2 Tax=Myxine glutinosa TaxID=7769 RepID=UPI00358E7E16
MDRVRRELWNDMTCQDVWVEDFPSEMGEDFSSEMEEDFSSSMSEEDLEWFFERKDLSRCRRAPIVQSVLSQRLDRCSQEVKNPFMKFLKFDGRACVGVITTRKIDVLFPGGAAIESDPPLTVVVVANARIQDVLGLICWQYTDEGRLPKLKEQVETYHLRIVGDNGEVDENLPPLDLSKPIYRLGFRKLALVEPMAAPTPVTTQADPGTILEPTSASPLSSSPRDSPSSKCFFCMPCCLNTN